MQLNLALHRLISFFMYQVKYYLKLQLASLLLT